MNLADLERNADTYPDTRDELAKYIFTTKYARYREDLGRRETWDEAVNRVRDMHLRKYGHIIQKERIESIDLDGDGLKSESKLENTIHWAFELVREKKVLPSMRAMQFGGPAIETNHLRQYNCAVRQIDSIRAFAEVFYMLLCGNGVGLGFTQRYLHRLPDLVSAEDKTGTVLTYVIEDTIEGWADSIEVLLDCYTRGNAFSGRKVVFDYSKIRKAGSPLKTSGGKAPGHEGLKEAHIKIKTLLDRIIEVDGLARMRSVDAYDIIMHCADAVLSGGVRRSATLALFDKDDEDMLSAKTGNWYEENPQRANANNSVLLIRGQVTEEEFAAILQRTKEWGEPGFVFADTEKVLVNPCAEIVFMPETDDGVCGAQVCNLTSINGGAVKTVEDFYEFTKAATVIGTLQAGYDDFKYLSNTARELTRSEALLGVSITGMFENPEILFDPRVQRQGAEYAKETNIVVAHAIGINPAARITCLKPEGSGTMAAAGEDTGSGMNAGIHAAHAYFLLRYVTANKLDNAYQWLRVLNPLACEQSQRSKTDDFVLFPIQVPRSSVIKDDLTAIEHLEIIKSTQENWVVPGTGATNKKPIHHSISCTVVVGDDEWREVGEYLFKNNEYFSAVSFAPKESDRKYIQPPFYATKTEEDAARFHELMQNWVPVDYTLMQESEDNTAHTAEAVCVGGACLI